MTNRFFINLLFPVLLAALCLNSAPAFVSGPALTQAADKAEITFTVNEPSDVEVAIINQNGKIVRHLAAGVLGGGYDPPQPLQPGLSQTLTWDGKDDYGQPAAGSPFSLRVRLNVVPVFERTISTRFQAGTDWERGPDNVDPQETYLSRNHPLFTDTTLYEEETKLDIAVNDETDALYINLGTANTMKHLRGQELYADLGLFNGRTGELLGILDGFAADNIPCHRIGDSEPALSWDGEHIYYTEASFGFAYCPDKDSAAMGRLIRFDKNGLKAPWSSTGLNWVAGFYNGDIHTRGHAVGPDGSIYVLHYCGDGTLSSYPACPTCTEPSGQTAGYNSPMGLSRVKDGVLVDTNLVVIYAAVGGVKIDPQGNIYISVRVKPHDKPVPDDVFLDSLDGTPIDLCSQAYWADEMYGSIVKFDPTGGAISIFDSMGTQLTTTNRGDYEGGKGRVPRDPWTLRNGDAVAVHGGFQWLHYGLSHVLTHSSWRTKCWCNVSRFDVDRFGRIFYPNTFMHEFCAIDNNRNQLFRLKNRDIPEVALGLGHQVEATDTRLFVADHFNNQVAVFTLEADVDTQMTIPFQVSVENGMSDMGGHVLTATPNPFNATLTISIPNTHTGKALIQIYDIRGKIVNQKRIRGQEKFIWDATGLGAGIYILKAGVKGRKYYRKLILQR